ncbi:MAG: endonuclease/exonuclease/phosphatase family protein [Candidatus Promineifilaceae bacterium]
MTRSENSTRNQPATIFTVVLTMILGIQMIRSLLPFFQSLLIERLDWNTIQVGLFALVVFLCAFLAGPLNRFLGGGLMILITSFVIGLSRLAAQLWTGDPIGQMIFTLTGSIAFILFLPTAVGFAAGSTRQSGANLALGLLAGLALDMALNGMFFTYDLIWQDGLWPTLTVALLVLAQWWSVFNLMRQENMASAADVRFSKALSWMVIGPFLFLELLVFSNIAWATTSTGLPFPAAFMWLLLAHLLGLAMWILSWSLNRIFLVLAWIATFAALALILTGQSSSILMALFLLSGQIALAGTLVAVLRYLGGAGSMDGLRNIGIAGGTSMLIMVFFLFTYYAVYDLPLHFNNQLLLMIAFLLIFAVSFAALLNLWKEGIPLEQSVVRLLTAAVLVMLLIPSIIWFTQGKSDSVELGNAPLRVMTYNIHFGTSPEGQLDLESLAQVIEAEQPDVVSLQEVSRGWVINGSMDMLVWLANRLQMDLFFGPASDAQWGNGVLTRVPILEQSYHALPTEDLLLKRGFIHTRLVGPNYQEIDLINTHYHHLDDGGDIREFQSQAILDYAKGLSPSIIMGDLNAEHGMKEIDMLVDSGYGDVLNLEGVEPGNTNPVPDPFRRIDYIFITPDLMPSLAVVPYSEASDHLPIAVTVNSGS